MRYSIVALMRVLTVPYAILIGSVLIGGAIAAAPLIAPYRITAGGAFAGTNDKWAWRLNTVTGEVARCSEIPDFASQSFKISCPLRGH